MQILRLQQRVSELQSDNEQLRYDKAVALEAQAQNLDSLVRCNTRLGDVQSQVLEGFRQVIAQFDREQNRAIHRANNAFEVSFLLSGRFLNYNYFCSIFGPWRGWAMNGNTPSSPYAQPLSVVRGAATPTSGVSNMKNISSAVKVGLTG